MATRAPESPLASAQAHIPMCKKHDLNIDITCEDCDVFICSQCVKTDHKDHDWKTIPTAGSLRRREIKMTLSKVKEEDLKEIDDKIKKASKQIEDNQKCCDSEVCKLQIHFDAIVSKIDEIKKKFENKLRENLMTKKAKVIEKKIDLEKKSQKIKDLAKFLEDKHSNMSDYSLIDNLRDLTKLRSKTKCDLENEDYSVRYRRGGISSESLESMMGQTFDLDDITVTETDSFQYGDECLLVLEAISKDTCVLRDVRSNYLERINIRNKKKEKINIDINDVCITDNGDMYATDHKNLSVVRHVPSGSVSTVFTTTSLVPAGICQSTAGGLLVTMTDAESQAYQPNSKSRRLVRHVTLTGDVIRDYEYQEDGQTRLFTEPTRVKQNGNTDICVVNRTSICDGELVVLSALGSLKSVYRGKDQGFQFDPSDVACDSHCDIIVSDYSNSQIHLLSPEGEFMKYLLTENEVTNPCAMSLDKSTLWLGNRYGLVKVFQYYFKT